MPSGVTRPIARRGTLVEQGWVTRVVGFPKSSIPSKEGDRCPLREGGSAGLWRGF